MGFGMEHGHEYYVSMTHAALSNDILGERFHRDQGCVFSGTLAVTCMVLSSATILTGAASR
jgi:hypothetical protein